MPIVIIPTDASGGGIALPTYRERLGDELANVLGFYLQTTVSTAATGGEARRVVLADEIRDDEAGFQLMGPPFVYVRTGGQAGSQSRVLDASEAGYQGANSALVLARPFAAALAANDTIEVTSPLPVKRYAGIKGLNDFVDEALALIRVAARLTFTGNGTLEYDLLNYAMIQSESDISGIADRQWLASTDPSEESGQTVRVVRNGVTRTLVTETLYSTSDTFYVDVTMDADRLIYDGASWTSIPNGGTPGLQADDDRAAAPEKWVVAFGMAKALEYLLGRVDRNGQLTDAQRKRLLDRIGQAYVKWATVAGDIKASLFPKQPLENHARPLIGVTGTARRWRR